MLYEVELEYQAIGYRPRIVSSFYETIEKANDAMLGELDAICKSYFKEYPIVKYEYECFKNGQNYNKNLYKNSDTFLHLRIPNGSTYVWRIKKFYD